MKELRVRKHPRLHGYDYSQNGVYFITFCVKDRHEMLGRIVGRDAPGAPCPNDAPGAPSMQLSEYGEVVLKEIEETPLHYSGILIDHFVIMPNHVHILISIQKENDAPEAYIENGAPRASRPTTALIPRIVTILKRKTNKTYGFDIWQTSYHDRIIRNEAEYQKAYKYIDENPTKWLEDCYFVEGKPTSPL